MNEAFCLFAELSPVMAASRKERQPSESRPWFPSSPVSLALLPGNNQQKTTTLRVASQEP